MPRLIKLDAPSVIGLRQFEKTDFYWMTQFEGFPSFQALAEERNGWADECSTSFAGIAGGSGGLNIESAGAANDYAEIRRAPSYLSNNVNPSWAKQRRFRTKIWVEDTDAIYHVLTGLLGDFIGFGFKLNNDGKIYGWCGKGAVLLTTLDLNVAYVMSGEYLLECRFYPTKRVEYYVDGVLRGTINTNLPTTAENSDAIYPLNVNSQQKTAVSRRLTLYFYEFWQQG